jgi:thioredoxin 1
MSSTDSRSKSMVDPLGESATATIAVEEALPRQPGLAMVHFRVASSEACDNVAAILAGLPQARAGRLRLTEIDVHERPELAARYDIRVTPTVLLVRDGDVVDRVIGGASRILLQSLLDARAPRQARHGDFLRASSHPSGPPPSSR